MEEDKGEIKIVVFYYTIQIEGKEEREGGREEKMRRMQRLDYSLL